ncbi:MAG: hypothetical protein HDT11_03780 [Helicobacter sp.]|nr:hypothetical protein [Helicobacter sp.]
MPLPLIPLVAAIGAGAAAIYSGKKGYDTYSDTQEASKYREDSDELYNAAAGSLNAAQEEAQNLFIEIGKIQARIVQNNLNKYGELVEKLELNDNVALDEILGKESLRGLREIKDSIVNLTTTLGGLAASSLAGAMAGFGAFGAAGLFASASTGTAIASLSGVAATNATLAFFGGGSLAAGGLGMAGGMWVLGGIVAAPALAIFATVLAGSAEKKKEDAKSYYLTIKALVEAMESEALTWRAVANRAKEKIQSLEQNDAFLGQKIGIVDFILQQKGANIARWEKNEQIECKTMMQLAETLVNTINAPLMYDEDSLTLRIQDHQRKCKNLIEEINVRWGGKK